MPEVEAHAHAHLVVLYPEVTDTGAVLGRREPLGYLAAVRWVTLAKVARNNGVKGAARDATLGYRATGRLAGVEATLRCLLLDLDCHLQAELAAAVDRLAHSRRGGVKVHALLRASAAAAQEKANRGLRQGGQRGRARHQLATLKPAHAAVVGLAALGVSTDQAVGTERVLLVVQEVQAAGLACLAQDIPLGDPIVRNKSGCVLYGNKVVPAKRARRLA